MATFCTTVAGTAFLGRLSTPALPQVRQKEDHPATLLGVIGPAGVSSSHQARSVDASRSRALGANPGPATQVDSRGLTEAQESRRPSWRHHTSVMPPGHQRFQTLFGTSSARPQGMGVKAPAQEAEEGVLPERHVSQFPVMGGSLPNFASGRGGLLAEGGAMLSSSPRRWSPAFGGLRKLDRALERSQKDTDAGEQVAKHPRLLEPRLAEPLPRPAVSALPASITSGDLGSKGPETAPDKEALADILAGGEDQVWGIILLLRQTEDALKSANRERAALEREKEEMGRRVEKLQREARKGTNWVQPQVQRFENQVVVLTGRVLQLQERIRKLSEEKAMAERETKALREAQIMPSPPDKARVDAPGDAIKPPQEKQGWGRVAGPEPEASREGRQGGDVQQERAEQRVLSGTVLDAGPVPGESLEGQQGEVRAAEHTRQEVQREEEVHAEASGTAKRKRGSSAHSSPQETEEECEKRTGWASQTSILLAQVEKAQSVLTVGVSMAGNLLQQASEGSAAAPGAEGSLVEQLNVARSYLDGISALISKGAPRDMTK